MVRCKMRVTEVLQGSSEWGGGGAITFGRIKLAAVMGKENESWSKATPSGTVEMQITNPAAYNQFKAGDTFFVDFTPAPGTEAEEKR